MTKYKISRPVPVQSPHSKESNPKREMGIQPLGCHLNLMGHPPNPTPPYPTKKE